ncbi:MAG TPA: metallophosphoesterase family protein [Flavisolibacter sp.]|jgi:putative phosphoesterase|nr:metallophosphoesterase family protein [Flavisolibacter sp.]
MVRIGLISDTHGYMNEGILRHLSTCDEVWHAGDFGSIDVVRQLQSLQTSEGKNILLRGVWGNIDGREIRSQFPEKLTWACEGVPIFMTHIGGYPKKYAAGIKSELVACGAKLFICGHSHILKIIFDESINCLHMNPGAAGKQGWHKTQTLVRFTIDEANIKDCEVIELGKK